MRRRQVLSTVGSGSIVGFSGCISVFGDDDIRLSPFTIINESGEETRYEVQVEYNGEVAEGRRLEIETNDSGIIECAWPEEPGQFLIRVRAGGDEWVEEDFSSFESDCAYVVIYHNAGDPRISISEDCPDEMC